MSTLQYHLEQIGKIVGVESPDHKPAKRGVMQLLEQIETAIHTMAEGRRFTCFVLRRDDLEAVIGAIKCAQIVQAQTKKGGGKS